MHAQDEMAGLGDPPDHREIQFPFFEDKARQLTRAILSERQLERLVEAVENLDKIDDVSRVGALLRGNATVRMA